MSTASGERLDCAANNFPGLREFEDGTLDPSAFDHEAHVYIAWALLEEDGPAGATLRYSAALRSLTRSLGIGDKYHETITWFFMALIAERRAAREGAGWPEFRDANPDLFTEPGRLLERFYSPARLGSSLAKRQFLLPDRAGV